MVRLQCVSRSLPCSLNRGGCSLGARWYDESAGRKRIHSANSWSEDSVAMSHLRRARSHAMSRAIHHPLLPLLARQHTRNGEQGRVERTTTSVGEGFRWTRLWSVYTRRNYCSHPFLSQKREHGRSVTLRSGLSVPVSFLLGQIQSKLKVAITPSLYQNFFPKNSSKYGIGHDIMAKA